MKRENFQKIVDGKQVDLFTLVNNNGIEMTVTNYGAKIVSLLVPDKKGIMTDVVLGHDSIDNYLASPEAYFGGICGRVAGRIAKGQFTLDGQEYQLAVNNGPNALHGGLKGFNAVVWEAKQIDKQTIELSYLSKDGEEGYPGNLNVQIIYKLTDDNAVQIDHKATTDKATIINLTNHSFFNLSGHANGSILDHLLQINADTYIPANEESIPYGKQDRLDGTPMDFRNAHTIGERINDDFSQLIWCRGYDHTYVVNQGGHELAFCAKAMSPQTGIVMDAYTTEPGIHLYTGNWLSGDYPVKDGKRYLKHSAFCLEAQHFPDSIHHPDFPSVVLRPNQIFSSQTIYKFSIMNTTPIQDKFKSLYGTEGAMYTAPGRINIIGEHTDYNGGFVLPGAIDKAMYCAIKPNGTNKVRAYALDLNEASEFGLEEADKPMQQWACYIFGMCREMAKKGKPVQGFDTVFAGDVPLGAGMSSSAALESCFGFALNDQFNLGFNRMEIALMGQATEHNYCGVKCGIMDQFASCNGKEGFLMRLDCRSLEFEYVPFNPKGYRLVLLNTCVTHNLAGGEYNKRRESCERVVAAIAKRHPEVRLLRDANLEMLHEVKDEVDAVDYKRSEFVIEEIQRLLDACEAMTKDDYEIVGQKMYETHAGLSQKYEVSCPELDFLNDIAKQCKVTGSRVMGGGFGGCTINLVKENLHDDFVKTALDAYEKKFGIKAKVYDVVIKDGARKL